METIFDNALVEQRRIRALAAEGRADFLLDLVAEDLALRLSAVERRFDIGAELHGGRGQLARLALATGRVGSIIRVESAAGFQAPDRIAPVDDVPFEPDSIDLALSPLSLQLVNDLPGSLVRIRRALRPDGLFLFAVPGAGTLAELRESLLAADAECHGGVSPRVAPFADVRQIGQLLQRAGFALPVTDVETHVVRYPHLFALMEDLRAMGMTNTLSDRKRSPDGRAFFARAAEIYQERFSDPDGRIRATVSLIYGSGWRPHDSQQKPLKPGSAAMRLEDALKRPQDDAT